MSHRVATVTQPIVNTFPHDLGDIRTNRRRNSLANEIAAKREGQTCARFRPRPEIANFCKTCARERELAFVNDDAGISASVGDGSKILIERDDLVVKLSEKKLEREKRARHFTGHGDYTRTEPLLHVSI